MAVRLTAAAAEVGSTSHWQFHYATLRMPSSFLCASLATRSPMVMSSQS